MGIGVQGEACGEVTQHAGHRLDVHAVLESDGGEGVPEVVEPDFRDASPFQHMLQHIGHIIRSDNAQLSGGHEVLIINVEKHGRDSVGSLFI